MFINYILLSSILSKIRTTGLTVFFMRSKGIFNIRALMAPIVCNLQFLFSNPKSIVLKNPSILFWILGFISKTIVLFIFIRIFVHRVISFFFKFFVNFFKLVYIGITCHSTLTFFVAKFKEFFYFFMD